MSDICGFCNEREIIGVYAADHGPFSLGYCDECLKVSNIRTKFNGLSKYGRFGDRAFTEYEELNGSEPMIHYNGNYIKLREYVTLLTSEDVEELLTFMGDENSLKNIIVNKFKEDENTRDKSTR